MICRACQVNLPKCDFVKKSRNKNGVCTICKNCDRQRQRDNYADDKSGALTRNKKWREENKNKLSSSRSKYYEKNKEEIKKGANERYAANSGEVKKKRAEYCKDNKEKITAHGKVAQAIKNGELTRLPCEVCGSDIRIQAHHDDYSKPLEVRWLCQTHHSREHKN